MKLVNGFLQPIELPLCILEEISPVRVWNKTLWLPPVVNPVEASSLFSEDGWKQGRHVTGSNGDNEGVAETTIRTNADSVTGCQARGQQGVDDDRSVGEGTASTTQDLSPG